jgi:uncharacterized protein YndB with AHSA1/START domain
MNRSTAVISERELMLSRDVEVPRERLFKAWTTQLPLWWGPHGTITPVCEMDLRPGGTFRTIMRTPDGAEFSTRGVFLEVIKNERIVFTDAYGPDWAPAPDILFTAIITFEEISGGRTNYTARALHWTVANCEKHERMGFHQGWGESLDRLVAIASRA